MRNISSQPPSEAVTIDSEKTVYTLDTQKSGLALSSSTPEPQPWLFMPSKRKIEMLFELLADDTS